MAYYIDIYSPETYENFLKTNQDITGFRLRQSNAAKKIKPGDKLVCYMTKLSRWVGILEVLSESFIDDSPRLYEKNDPFVVRFKVKPLIFLPKEQGIPIREDFIWNQLSFTKGHDKHSSSWTGLFRGSLNRLDEVDGKFLEMLLLSQVKEVREYPIDESEYRKWLTQRVKGPEGEVTVSVPVETSHETTEVKDEYSVRESLKVQALVAQIGEKMGFKIWLPRGDRTRVLQEWKPESAVLIDELPLSYDQATLKTIEQIDVLWLRRRSIIRAFEVEHTTSIYSGILRMADLLALQPNMDIKLHLVAPANRRDKVFEELQRPVFSLLERGPLAEACTFISYDSLYELAKQKHLTHLSDSVLEDYVENVE
jgi:predicted RNA-binding protein